MKIQIVALLVCTMVLSSEAKRGGGKGKMFLMMLKRFIDNSVCSDAGNALDGFTCAEGDMAIAIPWSPCEDLTAGEKPSMPEGITKPNRPCKDAATGDDWTSQSIAWVCMTGSRRDKTVATPIKCQNMVISGKCVENTRPFGPDIVPNIDACTAP